MSDAFSSARSPDLPARQIAAELRTFLRRSHVRTVRIAEGSIPPPQLAYMVNFPRLSLTLAGEDRVELEQNGSVVMVSLRRGNVLFVPGNCWNRPTWTKPVKVLTLLFGKRQTGISLVTHHRRADGPSGAIKTHIHLPAESAAARMLQALIHLAGQDFRAPADALQVEALLHCFLNLLEQPPDQQIRKGDRTFHNICLYLQEHFQFPLSRDSVADHFRLSPNHVSRLFRTEGLMKFTDYLTWVRIDRAKFLLRHHPALTLDEVARSCGFADTGYFCRIFKRRTKLTPTGYRMQAETQSLEPSQRAATAAAS